MGAPCAVVSKVISEAPMQAPIRREYGNVRIDKIKMEAGMKIGRFKQAFHREVVSPLPECFVEMDLMSVWGIPSYLQLGM